MNEIILKVRGLAKRFGPIQALSQVDFELRQGKLAVFLGENGAGKTTTLKIILGFLFPDAGSVEKIQPDLRLGYVPEQPAFFPWLKGREILELTGTLFGLNRADLDKKIKEFSARLSFDPAQLERPARSYSHGNQKKMAYLQSLLLDPDLLIVDEPFTALDPVAIRQVRDLFLEYKKAGRTLFISSHLISEAEKLADEIIIIRKGKTLVKVNWLEFLQDRIYLNVRRGSLAEKIILKRWPETKVRENILENFILKTDWEQLLACLQKEARGTIFNEVEIRPPDLESFFLFWIKD